MILFSSNGIFVNMKSTNPFVKFLIQVSPMRMGCELFYLGVTEHIKDYEVTLPGGRKIDFGQETLLKQLDFDYGYEKCYLYLSYWTVGMMLVSIMVIEYKYRR